MPLAAVSAMWFLCLTALLFRHEWTETKSVPLKSIDVATVPLFNAWTIGWNATQLQAGFDDYWNAPIFFPEPDAFAYSEPQPATLLVAPVVWLTGSIITAYKAWLFLAVALNGFVTGLLLRRLGYRPLLQIVGGTAVMMLPIVWQRIDVSQLISLWGVVWFWSCLMQLNQAASAAKGVETGIAFGCCFALCVHHSLFLSLLTPAGALLLIPRLRCRRFLIATALSLVTAAVIVVPIVWPIARAADRHEFARNEKLIRNLSARPTHYLATSAGSLIQTEQFAAGDSRQLCVGWVRMGCALLGLIAGLWTFGRRRWVAFIAVTGGTAFVFSQGLTLDWGGWRPWQFLMDHVPGVGQVRSVYRFAYFVQLAIVLLAVEGLAFLWRQCERLPQGWGRWTAVTICVLAPAVVVAAEVLPQPGGRGGIPEVRQHRTWTTFVREQATPSRPVLCLPMSGGSSVTDYDITTRWMCYGLEHRAPLINGYSGFFPPTYLALKQQVRQQFPTAEILAELARMDVQFVVVARIYRSPDEVRSSNSSAAALELVLEDPIGIDVYELKTAESATD